MDGVEVLAFCSLILLLAAAGLVLALEMGRTSGRASRVAAWFALTVLSVWGIFVVAFLFVNGVLFTFGRGVAAVALAACAIVLGATPIVIGLFVRRLPGRPSH